ncbi:hypothetical protein GS597_12215 [Synechococcales cyanobacterium C]|uniref:Uncharacterized protein n=1 Tax=Petrachloros mirabilis ULC683 TaxID=2781853 RepID=A0A8K2A0C9_9CYAN|nr:hypothetical protein [Petrachloros mirabilis]NCJ07256.1 hypothetical protein [Petrachloros mirabilis ULC683]
MTGPAAASCLLTLNGKPYVQLPHNLCIGYTDALIGQPSSPEYGTVICDRPENTYLFLQKLVGYTHERQAIWKIVAIQSIGQLSDDLIALSAGCTYKSGKTAPLVALVQDHSANYTTHAAWEVNLVQQSFDPIDPSTVICQDPFSFP